MSLYDDIDAALAAHRDEAKAALSLYRSYCPLPMERRAGMHTLAALAYRISLGRTVEQAAAREYLYRWHLAIKEPDQVIGSHFDGLWPKRKGGGYSTVSVFGAPHTIGM